MRTAISLAEIPQFVTAATLKFELRFDDEYDSGADKLAACAADANSHITQEMRAYAETTPVEEGSDVYKEIARVGLLYAQILWYQHLHQEKQVDTFKKTYEEAIKALKESLKVEPTSRQEPIGIERTMFEEERKVPFSQIGFGGSTENLY